MFIAASELGAAEFAHSIAGTASGSSSRSAALVPAAVCDRHMEVGQLGYNHDIAVTCKLLRLNFNNIFQNKKPQTIASS